MTPNELTEPYAENAEKSILSMMFLKPETIIPKTIDEGIDESWFYIPKHKILFNTLLNRYKNGQAIDSVSIAQHLTDIKRIDAVGGYPGLTEVLSFTTFTVLYQHHLEILKDKHERRLIIQLAIQAADTKLPFDLSDCMDVVERRVPASRHAPSYQESLTAAMRNIDDMMEKGSHICGLSTGFKQMDIALGGMRGGTLNIVGARPAMGKTALGLNIAVAAARDAKRTQSGRVLFLTLEMSSIELSNRLLQAEAEVNVYGLANLRSKKEQRVKREKLNQALAELSSLPLEIVEVNGWNINRISQFLTAEHRNRELALVVVDYIQLIKGTTKSAKENSVDRIAEVSNGMKDIARNLNVPVLALAQCNRDTAKGGKAGHAPSLSELQGSGSLEQDADSVILLHRPAYYQSNADTNRDDELAELHIAKNRHGRTAIIQTDFLGKYYLFKSR